MGNSQDAIQEGIIAEFKEAVEEPPLYKVLLHNDDYTTKVFVIGVLRAYFNKSTEEATQIMWHIHKNGIGVCGIYPYEVAETKVSLVSAAARENGYPLKSTLEPE